MQTVTLYLYIEDKHTIVKKKLETPKESKKCYTLTISYFRVYEML